MPKDRIYTDPLRCFAWGTDASFYRKVPQVVVRSASEEEISAILKAASGLSLPVTFRAAGTSLSGQGVSDSILVVAGKNWEKYSVSPDGERITLQPGLTGGKVGRILAQYGRKFGPDPASVASAMVGGIVANNASGMCCGVHANSDRMLLGVRLVFADGTVLDTASPESRAAFREVHPEIVGGIEALRDEIAADAELSERIKAKYSIKNVTGLNLRPFVAFSDPFDIIAHLQVGSEGTLAFLSQVTMATLPAEKFSASAMIYYSGLEQAARAVVALRGSGASIAAAEMLDRRSLCSVNDPHGDKGDAALLVKVEACTEEELSDRMEQARKVLATFETEDGVRFTSDPAECASYWAIRSGIFPTVGGMRAEGTTCLIEDVAFHIGDLPKAVKELSDLLDEYGYDDSCIYGHALEGNFHFVINQAFDTPEEVARYEKFIRAVAAMVVERYDGSLKAEHGTGRNMAPFVRYEWGERAYDIMKRVKALFDPAGLLGEGVIFNDDPQCFIKDLKRLPVIKPGEGAPQETEKAFAQLNKCIECGFCEVNCVSCGLTLSSRTRIALIREITALEASGDADDALQARKLRNAYRYWGEKTCAGDGLCSTSCPMGINVAELTHEIRRCQAPAGSASYKLWNAAAEHFPGTKNGIRAVLGCAEVGRAVLGEKPMAGLCRGLHKAGVPLWTPSMPAPYNASRAAARGAAPGGRAASGEDLKVVYFPSCFNQMMGASKGHGHSAADAAPTPARPLVEEMLELLSKAGYEVIFPEGMDSLCCGTIWESKGMPDIAERKVRELEKALLEASCNGKYPVLCDQSPCLHRMRAQIGTMHLYEPAEFIMKFLRDRLEFHPTDTPVAVHRTCSTRLMGLGDTIVDLARLCSTSVVVPGDVGCCGFAGDKGMTNPELNAWALRSLRGAVQEGGAVAGYSNSRTCELGLQTNSGIPYMSIVYLVNSCTTAKR